MLEGDRSSINFKVKLMSIATSERFRIILVSLLVLCLSPTAVTITWLDALHASGVDSKHVLFISDFSGGAASDLVIDKGSQLANCFDDLIKATLIPGWPLIVFARKSSPSFFDDNDSIINYIDRQAIPVRAPPIYHIS